MDPIFSHIDAEGRAAMVDVSSKKVTSRHAVAQAVVEVGASIGAAIANAEVDKGDVLTIARIAGIQAAKRTWELIPLCHPLPLHHIAVDLALSADRTHVAIEAEASVAGKTGVEMEALMAASVAALTVYDMCKSIDKGIRISQVQLLHKSGGKSGVWSRIASKNKE